MAMEVPKLIPLTFNVGNEVADYVKEYLVTELKEMQSFKEGKIEQTAEEIYMRIDDLLRTPAGKEKLKTYKKEKDPSAILMGGRAGDDIAMGTGCTACSTFFTEGEIICTNAGDSRCVLGVRDGTKLKAVEMSFDHKPDNEGEKRRIEKAGGFVEDNRVKGILNLSRSIGDLEYKSDPSIPPHEQMIIAFPEINKYKMSKDVEFMILACDGIWDCLTNQEAVDFVALELQKN